MTTEMTAGESTPGFDFFAAGELPVPLVSVELAERWAEEAFGLAVRAVDLGSQQDANFLLLDTAGVNDAVGDTAAGTPVAVMKISNSAFGVETVEDQDAAARWIADSTPALRTPTRVGDFAVREAASGSHIVRLIRYLDGGTLHGSGYLSPATVAEMGAVCGAVSAALVSLPSAPAERVLQWDLRQGPRVVEFLAEHIADADLRERIVGVTRGEARRVERVAASLPVQVVHGDLTDDNLMRSVAPDDGRLLDGVIDFGDLMLSWRVAELATTISSILHHVDATPLSVLPAIASFHAVRPLETAEIEALWPLVVIRGAVLVASGHQQVGADESNAYALDGMLREQLIFDRASSVPSEVMTAIVAEHLGFPHPVPAVNITPSRLFDTDARVGHLDLGVGSPVLDEGAWMTDESAGRAVDAAVGELFGDGCDVVARGSVPSMAPGADPSRPTPPRRGEPARTFGLPPASGSWLRGRAT
jgi:Ser/Thr protein kinase RdoA (MazF antagonist)